MVIETIEKALNAARIAQEKKGVNVSIINVEGTCSYADAIMIVSAANERQTGAISDAIVDEFRSSRGEKPLYREDGGGWSLLDFGDLIIHVFLEETRAFYDLDKLWAEAPRVPVPLLVTDPRVSQPPSALAQRGR